MALRVPGLTAALAPDGVTASGAGFPSDGA
ncbi:hypothetical protein J2S48_002735 [Promicromonospora iranensis]|uniref:Uncharacterized protein n=1 Tax=Promicromonospora iranensis TaxID=1105144 RepID=A0ABU2CPH1_9MICO|nr:hypothetical protein [Promicromonospora iranensis]